MSGGSSGGAPVAGTANTVTSGRNKTLTSGTTTGATTGEIQKTLPDWLSNMLQGQATTFGATTDQFGNAVGDWQAAGFSPDQLAGFQSMRDAVSGANFQTPMDELLATTRGDYLYGGPGFNAAVDAAYRAGVPQTLSQFGGAGRDQNFLGKEALNQTYADAFANLYNQERGRQQQSAQLLPGMSLLPGQTLQDIGGQYQKLEQYGQNYPLETLYPQYANLLQGSIAFADPFTGQTSAGTTNATSEQLTKEILKGISRGTETPAYFPGSQLAGAAGGALAGLKAGAMTGNPYLAAGGAIGGGLLGAYG